MRISTVLPIQKGFAMAEATTSSWSSNILCRYYLHGVCRHGAQCRFSHNMGDRPSMVCKFHLLGSCTYGEKCRYDHVKPSEESKSSESNKSQSVPKIVSPLQHDAAPFVSRMVTLKKQEVSADSGIGELEEITPKGSAQDKNPEEWVKAAEFVPGQLWKGSVACSYLDAAQVGLEGCGVSAGSAGGVEGGGVHEDHTGELCPYAAHGQCWYGENCTYLHGDVCDLCGKAILHPTDEAQRTEHQNQCMEQHEEDMELSFAVAASRSKTCGICMEVVMDKKPAGEARFGILSNCSHVFCITCIRKWRQAKQFENKIIRACPECRTKSDFVTPSKYWVEDKQEKLKLIEGYKGALKEKPCRYFDEGKGECPFNENCFYKHAYPDGRIASPKPVRRRRRQNAEGDMDIIGQLLLFDFLEEHRRRFTLDVDLEDEIDAILFHARLWNSGDSSDDSDYSDLEGFI